MALIASAAFRAAEQSTTMKGSSTAFLQGCKDSSRKQARKPASKRANRSPSQPKFAKWPSIERGVRHVRWLVESESRRQRMVEPGQASKNDQVLGAVEVG